MLSTASAINELAQTSSASEGNILDFTTRLSSMAKTANMTQAQVMGLGAMFETQGLNAEVAATALAKVMQKMGTDTGYKRGNGGDLKFLGKDYRKEHKLGKAREPRPWFSKSWYISTQVIKDVYARFVGDQFVGIMDNLGK